MYTHNHIECTIPNNKFYCLLFGWMTESSENPSKRQIQIEETNSRIRTKEKTVGCTIHTHYVGNTCKYILVKIFMYS